MKVLVIEDNTKISNSLKKGLEQKGFAVDVAQNGEIGLDFALDGLYDVILLDLMLPKISGEQVCKEIRNNKIATPILMLTAKSELEDKINGLNIGADDYLVKPFSFDELIARIRALLRRPKNYTSDLLQCNDVVLNIQQGQVKVNNKNVELSKKEISLLEYFLRNKNKVLSKDLIIEHVWDFDSDVLPNTVEVYVGYLRNKLNSKSFIKTVRGLGYKIECE